MFIQENLEQIKANIIDACKQSNRNPNEIKIIAVTKYVSVDTTKKALEAGITHLGENRDFGFLDKWEAIGDKPTWHFIGSLQSKKVKNIIDKVDYIHSLDRVSLAKEIDKRSSRKSKCFVQINAANEESKHGLSVDEVIPFIKELEQFPNVVVEGLMTMAPYTDDQELLRNTFKQVKELQQKIKALNLTYAPCNELSMGMSNDYVIAVEEGATMIRIGTSLVGKEF